VGKPSTSGWLLDNRYFDLSFAVYETYFDVTTDVAVRFDGVESLVNEPNQLLSAAEKKKTATLGCELGNFRDGRSRVWEGIGTGSDVGAVADSIVAFFAEVGLPYLKMYSSMEAALAILKGDDRQSRLHSPIHAERAKRAVALAQVLFGLEEAKRIADEKRKRVRELDSTGSVVFERFADWLMSRALAAGASPHRARREHDLDP